MNVSNQAIDMQIDDGELSELAQGEQRWDERGRDNSALQTLTFTHWSLLEV